MINESRAKKYCYEELSLIENYEQAVNDQTQTWDLHHRNETVMNCGPKQLVAKGAYYDRPARELVFLTHAEHTRLHKKGERNHNFGRPLSEETRSRISEALKGKPMSEETRHRISEAKKGKPKSEEHRRMLSEAMKGKTPWNKGKPLSEEARRRLSEAMKGERNHNFGRQLSEETRRRISEARKAYWKNRREAASRLRRN